MEKLLNLYNKSLQFFEEAFVYLEGKIERPEFVSFGSKKEYRYNNKSLKAAIIQKLARVVSGLHASIVLLEGGYVQELGAIFRTLDEFNEDIIFLCAGLRARELSDLHNKYLEYFYQEEFNIPNNPFLSDQKRPTIPRKKIRAAICGMKEYPLNPSDAAEVHRTISQAYSGYVHGASPHIMEMYGGHPPKFYVSGMKGTPRIAQFASNCSDYFYRGLHSIMLISLSFNEKAFFDKLVEFRKYFEIESDKTDLDKYEGYIKKIKRNK